MRPSSPEEDRDVARLTGKAEDFADFLREETTGGRLLLIATALALLWANLSDASYSPTAARRRCRCSPPSAE